MKKPSSKTFRAETIVWSPERELFADIVSAPRDTWELRGKQKKIKKTMIHGLFRTSIAAAKEFGRQD